VLAEVELPAADFPLTLPEWVGAEVTGQPQYYNHNMGIEAR
jgi:CYTH domain-containing protein